MGRNQEAEYTYRLGYPNSPRKALALYTHLRLYRSMTVPWPHQGRGEMFVPEGQYRNSGGKLGIDLNLGPLHWDNSRSNPCGRPFMASPPQLYLAGRPDPFLAKGRLFA